MRTALMLRSLYPNTPFYTWTSGEGWYSKEGDFPFPKPMWLSNQTGLQVGCYCAVDIDSFSSLIGHLPTIVNDLYLDAAERIGFRNTTTVSKNRWERLSRPRPLTGPAPEVEPLLYATYRNETYKLCVDAKGRGGWYVSDTIDKEKMPVSFEAWDYTFYAQTEEKLILPAPCARRVITATLDSLYCHSEDEVMRLYFAWAQAPIKRIWEENEKQ